MEKIMLMGPYPPPECGTSIPFKLLADYIVDNTDKAITIINASGDPRGVPLYSLRAIKPFFQIMFQYFYKIPRHGTLFVYGSQRFIATVGSLLTFINSRILRKKTIVYIQGGYFDQYLFKQKRILKSMLRLCLNSAFIVGVQTKLIHENLRKELRNVVQIPNWIDTRDILTKETVNSDPSLPKKVFRLVFAGQVIPEKGVLELIDAFGAARAGLFKAGLALRIDIFGPTKPRSEKIIKDVMSSCSAGLKYHGPIEHDELMRLLREYDALVLPTKYQTEGYPAILLEAMASGLPVITTIHRAIPEIVQNEYNGFIYDQNDIEALREAIMRMAIDPVLWQTMSDNAKQSARKYEAPVVLRELCQTFEIFS